MINLLYTVYRAVHTCRIYLLRSIDTSQEQYLLNIFFLSLTPLSFVIVVRMKSRIKHVRYDSSVRGTLWFGFEVI